MHDLGIPHKKHREIGVLETLLMSLGFLTLGVGFGRWVWLIFIGSKTFVAGPHGVGEMPRCLSLGATFAILAAGILRSLWRTRSIKTAAAEP